MEDYWRHVAKRAWREAAKSVGIETKERVVVALLIQAIIALGFYFSLGATALHDAIIPRLLTAAGPFMIFTKHLAICEPVSNAAFSCRLLYAQGDSRKIAKGTYRLKVRISAPKGLPVFAIILIDQYLVQLESIS